MDKSAEQTKYRNIGADPTLKSLESDLAAQIAQTGPGTIDKSKTMT